MITLIIEIRKYMCSECNLEFGYRADADRHDQDLKDRTRPFSYEIGDKVSTLRAYAKVVQRSRDGYHNNWYEVEMLEPGVYTQEYDLDMFGMGTVVDEREVPRGQSLHFAEDKLTKIS